jgi:hypothetical protein
MNLFGKGGPMWGKIRVWEQEFVQDPLGTLINLAVWIFIAGIGVTILVYFGKAVWRMVQTALDS